MALSTDPALLKMLLLAHRKQPDPMASLLNNGALVPVSLSYEIDPVVRQRRVNWLRLIAMVTTPRANKKIYTV